MTDKYAVIGNPIAHSKSPLIHKMFAQQTGQDISYEAILAPLEGFAATIERLRKEGCKGCNITVPFKFEAFQLATELTGRAKAAQAVNTLKFDGDTILGDNTDGAGLVRDIQHNHKFSLKNCRVLLMGAGGAAYGVVLPLLAAGAKLTVVNRTHSKAQQLFQTFVAHGNIVAATYEELKSSNQQFDVVINATSSGLSDDLPLLPRNDQIPPGPPFTKGEAKIPPFVKGGPGGIFAPVALAYDMMYGRETPFMKFAREQGAAIVSDGLGMLVEQAAESFFIWHSVRPDTAEVMTQLRETI